MQDRRSWKVLSHGRDGTDKLNENDIVELDEERKAAMVSNLLVVLCGNKDAQPIVKQRKSVLGRLCTVYIK